MRVAPQITLADEDRRTLERWARERSTHTRQVLRAQIVLAAAAGRQNRAIAAELAMDRMLVGKWRKRFAEKGLAGIEKDAPRGGRKPTARNALAAKIIEWTLQKSPPTPRPGAPARWRPRWAPVPRWSTAYGGPTGPSRI